MVSPGCITGTLEEFLPAFPLDHTGAAAESVRSLIPSKPIETKEDRSLMPYSSRISLEGSADSALRAGMAEATAPRDIIVTTAARITTGSLGSAW